MPFESYRDLIVWQKSFDLAFEVYQITRPFPREERYGLVSQLRRAGLSISNNIAEGHGRATRGEFRNALSASRGSANEVENCLLFSERLNFVNTTDVQKLYGDIEEIRKMLSKFRMYLRQ